MPVLVGGTLLLALAMLLCGFAAHAALLPLAGSLALAGVLLFALGEMIASPKSQEYVAAIAPANKTAMFMGYYFVAMALGNLFGGLLSGWAYQHLARQGQGMLMWQLFAVIGGVTALALCVLARGQRRIAT